MTSNSLKPASSKMRRLKIAVMQPYFLPYLGYFQLLAAVDRFVVLDDVNYINRGWINRNRISSPHGTQWLTIPLSKASQNRLIREIEILPDNGWKMNMSRSVTATYSRAPEAAAVLPLFLGWLTGASGNLSTFLYRSLTDVVRFVGLTTELIPTSAVYPRSGLKGSDRILDICRREGATTYVNLPGGRDLYDSDVFSRAGIQLQFLQPQLDFPSLRYSGSEGPILSILDLMMLNSSKTLREAVTAFRMTPTE